MATTHQHSPPLPMDADDPDIEALFDGLLPQDPETFAMFAVDEKHHLSNDRLLRSDKSTAHAGEGKWWAALLPARAMSVGVASHLTTSITTFATRARGMASR